MINPWAIVGVLLAWAGSLAGVGWWMYGAGQDHCEAATARDDRVAQVAYDSAASAAASAIAKIEVKNTTIKQTLQKEVYERQVFRDCRSGPDAVRLLNATAGASQASAGAASGVAVPGPGPADR